MKKNPYSGKPSTRAKLGAGLVPHLLGEKKNQAQKKKWFISLAGKPILPRKKGAGFIVIEGLDGSGQSSQADLLADFLKRKGFAIFKTKEPTKNSKSSKLIREILDKKKRISPGKLQILFAKDRKEHLEKEIIPALENNKIVISDRYFFSSFAYGVASNLNLNWLIKINNKFLFPDLTFFLDVKPKICLKRILKRGENQTFFEKEEKLRKVYQNYKEVFKKFFKNCKKIHTIDGEKPIKKVFNNIRTCLAPLGRTLIR